MEKSNIKKKKRKNSKSTNPVKRTFKIIGTLLLSVFLVVIITGSIFATVLTIYVLNFADTTTTVSLDRIADGNVTRFLSKNPDYKKKDKNSREYDLYYAMKNESQHFVWVDLEDIPQCVQDAFVYTEDERFYSHDGVDFKRTFAAIVRTLMGNMQGGSTITQQTIKQLTKDDARSGFDSVERKIREIFRAINVEKTYTKEDILQSYLNVVPMTTQQYDIIGVQAAANFYFGKDVKDLDLAEAACLAGMNNAPADNNPVDSLENNNIRRKYCLDQMLENGAISEQEYNEALNERRLLWKKLRQL